MLINVQYTVIMDINMYMYSSLKKHIIHVHAYLYTIYMYTYTHCMHATLFIKTHTDTCMHLYLCMCVYKYGKLGLQIWSKKYMIVYM